MSGSNRNSPVSNEDLLKLELEREYQKRDQLNAQHHILFKTIKDADAAIHSWDNKPDNEEKIESVRFFSQQDAESRKSLAESNEKIDTVNQRIKELYREIYHEDPSDSPPSRMSFDNN